MRKVRINHTEKNYNHLIQELLNYFLKNHDLEFNKNDIIEIIKVDLKLDYADNYIDSCISSLLASGLIETTTRTYPKYYAVNYETVTKLKTHINNMKL